jgi:hypothetical protein
MNPLTEEQILKAFKASIGNLGGLSTIEKVFLFARLIEKELSK